MKTVACIAVGISLLCLGCNTPWWARKRPAHSQRALVPRPYRNGAERPNALVRERTEASSTLAEFQRPEQSPHERMADPPAEQHPSNHQDFAEWQRMTEQLQRESGVAPQHDPRYANTRQHQLPPGGQLPRLPDQRPGPQFPNHAARQPRYQPGDDPDMGLRPGSPLQPNGMPDRYRDARMNAQFASQTRPPSPQGAPARRSMSDQPNLPGAVRAQAAPTAPPVADRVNAAASAPAAAPNAPPAAASSAPPAAAPNVASTQAKPPAATTPAAPSQEPAAATPAAVAKTPTAPAAPAAAATAPPASASKAADEKKEPAASAELIAEAVNAMDRELRNAALTDRERLNLNVRQRMMLLAAGRYKDAVQEIEHLEPAHQNYLNNQLYSLQVYLDEERLARESHRAAAAARHARDAADELGAIGKLQLRNAAFCQRVKGFGRFAAFENITFEPGQEVLIYVEVDNFKAAHLPNGDFETELQGSYAIMSNGRRQREYPLPLDLQQSKSRRRDYYIAYRIYLPKDLDTGDYQLELMIEDKKGKKSDAVSLEFKVLRKTAR